MKLTVYISKYWRVVTVQNVVTSFSSVVIPSTSWRESADVIPSRMISGAPNTRQPQSDGVYKSPCIILINTNYNLHQIYNLYIGYLNRPYWFIGPVRPYYIIVGYILKSPLSLHNIRFLYSSSSTTVSVFFLSPSPTTGSGERHVQRCPWQIIN